MEFPVSDRIPNHPPKPLIWARAEAFKALKSKPVRSSPALQPHRSREPRWDRNKRKLMLLHARIWSLPFHPASPTPQDFPDVEDQPRRPRSREDQWPDQSLHGSQRGRENLHRAWSLPELEEKGIRDQADGGNVLFLSRELDGSSTTRKWWRRETLYLWGGERLECEVA